MSYLPKTAEAFEHFKQRSDAAFILFRGLQYVVLAARQDATGQNGYIEWSGSVEEDDLVTQSVATSSREEATRAVIELAGIHVFNGYNPAFHHLPANDDTETLTSLAKKGTVRTSPKAR